MPILAWWTYSDYADTLLQRTSNCSAQALPADPEQAMSLLNELQDIFTGFGMRPLMQLELSLRDILRK